MPTRPFINALRGSLLSMVSAGAALATQASTAGMAVPTAATNEIPTAGSSRGEPARDYRPMRASQLIGMQVRARQGRDVGRIEDLVVDMRSGRLRYVMLSFDPGVLDAEQLVPIPTSRLEMNPGSNGMVYQATLDELQRTAAARSEWDDTLFADPNQLTRIDRAWGAARTQPQGDSLRLASKLLGQEVNDRARQSAGKVDALVVDMARRQVHYAVVALEPSWLGVEKRVVLPLRSLQAKQGQRELVLHADKARLQQMQGFSQDRYAQLDNPALRNDVDRWLSRAGTDQTRGAIDARAADAPASAPDEWQRASPGQR